LDAAHSVNVELANKLKDPEFRYQVGNRHARTRENEVLIARANSIGNFFGNLGFLVKTGIISRELAVNIWWNHAVARWDDLRLFTAIIRHTQGEVWTDFEYFVVLSQDYIAAHPAGSYPVGVRRLALDYEFLEADKQYAASRVA